MAKVKSSPKTIKHNTLSEVLAKDVPSYKDLLFMREIPITEEKIDHICAEWWEWAQKDTSLRIKQFWNERGIPHQTAYRWMKDWPQLQEMHDRVLEKLAERRDIGALIRKYDGAQVRETLGMYDPDFRAFMQFRASLAKKEDAVGGITTVEIPVFIKEDT